MTGLLSPGLVPDGAQMFRARQSSSFLPPGQREVDRRLRADTSEGGAVERLQPTYWSLGRPEPEVNQAGRHTGCPSGTSPCRRRFRERTPAVSAMGCWIVIPVLPDNCFNPTIRLPASNRLKGADMNQLVRVQGDPHRFGPGVDLRPDRLRIPPRSPGSDSADSTERSL